MEIIIRTLEKTDAPKLAGMETEIFSIPWSEQEFAKLPERDYCCYLVAERDGELIGCVGMTMLCGEGDIDKVMVVPSERKQGIAYKLLCELLRMGNEKGLEAYTLEVRAGNTPAIKLYEKLGFVNEGIRPKYYEKPVEDAVIMWLRR